MSGTPDMTLAQVLYDSVFRLSTSVTTYSGTVVPGFEPVNFYDWRDFSLFRPEAAAVAECDTNAVVSVDTICVWWAATGTDTVAVEGLISSVWTPLVTVDQADGAMQWVDIPSVAVEGVRCVFDGTNDIRQITIGRRLQFPIGQWQGVAPPKLLHGVVVETVISVNGSILGRNLRRITKEGQLSLNYLLQDWVRDYWNPFAIHASRYAFWWRWNPVTYPTEIAFTVADKIEAPKNSSPPGRMEVSMPLLYLS